MDSMELLLPEDELVELFSGYLGTLHCSGFGRYFSIHSREGRDQAAQWLADVVFGMLEFENAHLQ